jgi:hypothetical protein
MRGEEIGNGGVERMSCQPKTSGIRAFKLLSPENIPMTEPWFSGLNLYTNP